MGFARELSNDAIDVLTDPRQADEALAFRLLPELEGGRTTRSKTLGQTIARQEFFQRCGRWPKNGPTEQRSSRSKATSSR
jgi:hypothetical protein